jgi:hypothetical protein
MIRTITHREYLVSCDGCGRAGPPAATLEQASEHVRREGWQAVTPWRGFDFLTSWFCPACQRARTGLGADVLGPLPAV